MVLERRGRAPVPSRRRLERAAVHVRRLRRAAARSSGRRATASAWRNTSGRCRRAVTAPGPRSRRSSATAAKATAGRRRHLRGVSGGSTPTIAAPLNAVVEATEETEAWSKQTVAFDAAYGGERMRAHLFLPKNASPPYQTVVFFPAGRRVSSAIEPRHVAAPWVTSSSAAAGRSSTRSTRAPTSGRSHGRAGTERGARAPNRLVARPRTRHRLSRDAAGHRSQRASRSTASAPAPTPA